MPPPIRRTGPHGLLDLSGDLSILTERIHRALNVPPPVPPTFGSPYRTPEPPPGAREAVINEALAILVQREPSLDIRPGSVVRTLIETSVASLTPQELAMAQTTAREEYAEQVADELTVHGTYADPATTRMPEFRPSMLREMIETVERLRPPHDDRVDAFRYAMMPPMPSGLNPCGEIPLTTDPPWMMQEQVGSCVVNARAIDHITVPEIPLVANPQINIDDIRERRYSMTGRRPRKDPPLIEALIKHRRKQYTRPAVPPPPPPAENVEPKSLWQRLLEEDDG